MYVIVGTGAGGAIIARELAITGFRVIAADKKVVMSRHE